MKKGFEIVKATLKKARLEDLMQFVERQGGITFVVTGRTPKMDADFRAILVTVIALNTAMRMKAKSPARRCSRTRPCESSRTTW